MEPKKQLYISVIGASKAEPELAALAEEIGFEIGRRNHVMVCGGLGGVMDAAAKGANRADGVSLGILPDDSRQTASPYLTLSIPTSMSHGRNFLVVLSGDGVIAVGGEFGTLSEIAYAVKLEKPLVIMAGWEINKMVHTPEIAVYAKTAKEAVDKIEEMT